MLYDIAKSRGITCLARLVQRMPSSNVANNEAI